jgi:hypothetical protein
MLSKQGTLKIKRAVQCFTIESVLFPLHIFESNSVVKTEIGKSMELLLEKHPVGIVGSKHRKVADGGVFGANTANLLVTNTDISTLVLIKTATNTLIQTVTNTSKAPAKKSTADAQPVCNEHALERRSRPWIGRPSPDRTVAADSC